MSSVNAALEFYKSGGTFRTLQVARDLIDFSSNDYLGLSYASAIRTKLRLALRNGCPLGATGSRLLSGQTEIHERVENFLQSTFQIPSALLFSSGFMANLGVIAAFSSVDAHFFSDEENHASVIDGMRLSRSPKSIYRHTDLGDLEVKLATSKSATKVIVSESVFSMSGDVAPILEIHALAKKFDAWLVIDEAHSTGIFGKLGLGILSDLQSHDSKIVSVHTGGKALGGQGSFVLSSIEFRELMINSSRSFIFTTALSPLSALQIQFALEEVLKNPRLGCDLLERAAEIRKRLSVLGLIIGGKSQIVPIILGSNEKVQKASQYLKHHGFDVRPIRSPTVPQGSERLRITLKSSISKNILESFITTMEHLPI